jgi:hypothetical protein
MIGDPIGRSDLELPADLMDRRREALLANGLEQEIVDRFLPGSQRGQHESRYTEIIFSSQEFKNYRSNGSSRSNSSND